MGWGWNEKGTGLAGKKNQSTGSIEYEPGAAAQKTWYTGGQAVINLASDKTAAYEGMLAKAKAAGDADRTKGYAFGEEVGIIPDMYLGERSRLVVIGHGNPGSTHLYTSAVDTKGISPEALAAKVDGWLGNSRVRRLSLVMCFGGGNRTGYGNGDRVVAVEESFAWKLAKEKAIIEKVAEISARRHQVKGRVIMMEVKTAIWDKQATEQPVAFRNEVGGTYHDPDYKAVLKPGEKPSWEPATWGHDKE